MKVPFIINMVLSGAKMRCENDISQIRVARVRRVSHDYPLGEPLHRILGLLQKRIVDINRDVSQS